MNTGADGEWFWERESGKIISGETQLFQDFRWWTGERRERRVSDITDVLHAFGRRVVATGGEIAKACEKFRSFFKLRCRFRGVANIVTDRHVFTVAKRGERTVK